MLAAIIIGYLIGIPIAVVACRWLLMKVAEWITAYDDHRKWIRRVGGIFAATAAAPAIFLGTMLGGVFHDEAVAMLQALGVPRETEPVIFGLLMAVVTVLTIMAGAAAGAVLGFIMARSMMAR